MATSAGLQCEVDPVLCQALRAHKGECLIKGGVFTQFLSPEGPYFKRKRRDCERKWTKVRLELNVKGIPSGYKLVCGTSY